MIEMSVKRSLAARPWRTTRSIKSGSMLPPESTATVRPFGLIFFARIAATLTAPAGGTLSTVQPVNLVTGQPVATGTPAPASGSGSSQLPLLLLAGGGLLIFALMD